MVDWKKLGIISLFTSGVFFILTVVLFYFYTNSLDEKYNTLIKRETNNFQTLHKITMVSNRNYFILNDMLQTDDTMKIDSLAVLWKITTRKNSDHFDKLTGNIAMFSNVDVHYRKLMGSRGKYLAACDGFFRLNHSGNKIEREGFYIMNVNRSFINYQVQLEEFVDTYKAELLAYSDKMTSEHKTHSFLYILFGFSPVILSLLFVLVMALFVLGFVVYIHIRPIEGL